MIKYVTFLLCPCVSCNPRCSPTISPGFWKRSIFNGRHCYSCLNLNYNGEFMWKCSSRVMVLRRWLRLPPDYSTCCWRPPFPCKMKSLLVMFWLPSSYRLLSRFADNTFDSLPLCNILVSGTEAGGKLNCPMKNSLPDFQTVVFGDSSEEALLNDSGGKSCFRCLELSNSKGCLEKFKKISTNQFETMANG